MPPELLLFVFVTHLPFFAWRFKKTGEFRYAATTLTFALLVMAYGTRVFAPEASFRGMELFPILRVVAWCAAALSIGLLIRHAVQRRRVQSDSEEVK